MSKINLFEMLGTPLYCNMSPVMSDTGSIHNRVTSVPTSEVNKNDMGTVISITSEEHLEALLYFL